jgi:hypothetical protein
MPKHDDKKKKRIMRKFSISEISMVDRAAQAPATMRIMKRDTFDLEDSIAKFLGDMILTTSEDSHAHRINIKDFDWSTNQALGFSSGGETSWSGATTEKNHTHPWIMKVDGEIIIGEANGHTHDIDEISKQLFIESHEHAKQILKKSEEEPEWVNTFEENSDFEKLFDKLAEAAVADGITCVDEEESDMTKDTKTAADIKKAADKEISELKAELEISKKVAGLSTLEKSHYDALSDDDKTTYLAKEADDRELIAKAAIKNAEDENPVIYKSDSGVEYRKSDGAGMIELAKQGDIDRKENAKLRKAASEVDLRKRAEDDLSNLPGSVETHMALLKSVESIKDDVDREEALKSLKAQNTAMGKAYETLGAGGEPVDGTPEAELDTLAKKYATEHEVTYAVAYTKVLETNQGSELYAKALN